MYAVPPHFARRNPAIAPCIIGARAAHMQPTILLLTAAARAKNIGIMKKTKEFLAIAAAVCAAIFALSGCSGEKIELKKSEIADKIKGGWAGQIIGCTYGGPTEFKYKQKIIPDEVKIKWDPNRPIATGVFGGLYDDLYLDITFMDVFERFGFGAPRIEFQRAVGESTYYLWAANRAARFAWLDGFQRGEPTSWRVNPSYNDIDFQIETDFAGLMAPALPNEAVKFAEPAGRSINSNDGFYCGAYVAAMYALAFVSSDMEYVASRALKVLPSESRTRKMMSDVIDWHKQNPSDWKAAWQKFEDAYVKKHDANFGSCYIHAPINCAYILIGLLYGGGDFEKTIDISTRCGLDSDCNPANAGGILATAIGYSKIPEKFRKPLEACSDKLFLGTSYSPDKVYKTGLKHALAVLKASGAEFDGDTISVPVRPLTELPLESDAPSKGEVSSKYVSVKFADSVSVEFEGCGVVLYPDEKFCKAFKDFADSQKQKGFAGEIAVFLDGKEVRTAKFFTENYRNQRSFIFAERGIENGKHRLELRFANAKKGFPDFSGSLQVFSRVK